MSKTLTIALAGNPNSGKSTIFNNLTGAHQKVANWPGVTVEKKIGKVTFNEYEVNVVDLPGTYSLTAASMEEVIARNFVIKEKPDVVVDILDASNLERNLYLATRFKELGVKLVFALNMVDVAKSRGLIIDENKLGNLLGVPIVSTVGTKNIGTLALLQTVVRVAEGKDKITREIPIYYGEQIEEEIKKIEPLLYKLEGVDLEYPSRWLTLKLLENDQEVVRKIGGIPGGEEVLEQKERSSKHLEEIFREDPETIIIERRYGFISGAIKECVKTTKRDKFTTTDAVDKIVINRILGFPIFFLSMWLLFQLTFVVGAVPVDLMDKAIVSLQRLITLEIPEGLLRDLLVDGIIGGVGNVAIFVPTILILFLGISFLEDSGYMARAAFVMDRVMHTLGLHGKSFIPLLMGFGCNVPAIMATRMLESKRDRILTMLINPLMSCSARLPVYVLLSGAFFGRHQGTAIFSIYLLGIVLAIVIGRIFKKILFPGESAPFVMELPPYRMPTLKGTLMHMWERGSIYLKKMGGVILICSVVIWFLGTFPRNTEYKTKVERLENTYIGKMGKAIEPALKHLGFDWKLGVSLISGFVAKEVVVSTIGVLYHVEETGGNKGLRDTLASSGISPLVAYGFMVFVLTYTPCVASAVAVGRESGSFRWTALTIGYGLCLAWILSFTIYQGGRLLGWA